jgi:putative phage-type endonuclease
MSKIEIPKLYSSNEYYSVVQFDNKSDWLKARQGCIGASEASCILEKNPFKTKDEYIEELRNGKAIEKKSSSIKYGVDAEELIREMFKIHNKSKYDLQYESNVIVYNKKYPMLSCSPDGLLFEKSKKSSNRKGIYEGKTGYVSMGKVGEWTNELPNAYYIQLLHQLLVMEDLEFAVLNAELKFYDKANKEYYYQTKEYIINRIDIQADIDYLLQEELKFIEEHKEIAFRAY